YMPDIDHFDPKQFTDRVEIGTGLLVPGIKLHQHDILWIVLRNDPAAEDVDELLAGMPAVDVGQFRRQPEMLLRKFGLVQLEAHQRREALKLDQLRLEP